MDVANRFESWVRVWESGVYCAKSKKRDETFEEYKVRGPTPTEDVIKVGLFLDASAITEDADLCKRVVEMFVLMARGLESFYALAYIERGFARHRGSYAYTSKTVHYRPPIGPEWIGIPPVPVWLNWFGRPYKPLVLDALKPASPVVFEDGVFVRLDTKPADARQLQAIKVDLPAELLIRQAVDNTVRGQVLGALKKLEAKETKEGSTQGFPIYVSERAEFIPKLD